MRRLTALTLSGLFATACFAVMPQAAGRGRLGRDQGPVRRRRQGPTLPPSINEGRILRRTQADRSFGGSRRQRESGERGGLSCGRGGRKSRRPSRLRCREDEPAVLDNKGCSFHPHVSLIRTGQPLVIKNSDPVGHNTNVESRSNGQTNTTIPANGQSERRLTKGEALPMPVNCNIHPFMHAFVLVQDHPYMAVSARTARSRSRTFLPASMNSNSGTKDRLAEETSSPRRDASQQAGPADGRRRPRRSTSARSRSRPAC